MRNIHQQKIISLGYSPEPVEGSRFHINEGQDVLVHLGEDKHTGRVIRRASHPSSQENQYHVKLSSGVWAWYGESQLTARWYGLFDEQKNLMEGKLFKTEYDVIDAEEDFGYDSLEAQYHAADGMPDNLVSHRLQAWEIANGMPIRRVVLN